MTRAFSTPPITNLERQNLIPYTLDGPEFEPLTRWLPVTYDHKTGRGSYFFQMLPGCETKPHVHQGFEEFYVLEGEGVESDGTVIKAGDFISYQPGTYHKTVSAMGLLALVVEWRP